MFLRLINFIIFIPYRLRGTLNLIPVATLREDFGLAGASVWLMTTDIMRKRINSKGENAQTDKFYCEGGYSRIMCRHAKRARTVRSGPLVPQPR